MIYGTCEPRIRPEKLRGLPGLSMKLGPVSKSDMLGVMLRRDFFWIFFGQDHHQKIVKFM